MVTLPMSFNGLAARPTRYTKNSKEEDSKPTPFQWPSCTANPLHRVLHKSLEVNGLGDCSADPSLFDRLLPVMAFFIASLRRL